MIRFSPMRWCAAFAVGVVWLAGADTASAQQIKLVSSQIAGKDPEGQRAFTSKLVESKLSPEMHAVVTMNGEFRGFTKIQAAVAGGNPYRAIIGTKIPVGAVPLVEPAANEFYKVEAVPMGAVAPAAVAEPTLQVSYKGGEPIGEKDLADAGFTIVKALGKTQIIDLGAQGGAITVKPTNGFADKAKIESILKLKGLKYFAPIYPTETTQQPQVPERSFLKPATAPAAVSIDNGVTAAGVREPNEPYYANTTDPTKPNLWGMRNINAPKAWAKQTDATSLIVAVIDTGVDFNHVDLKDNMWVNPGEVNGQSGVDNDGNGYVNDVHGIGVGPAFGSQSDPNGHGSHCAGTIGGVGDNGKGVAGVCWRAKIMGIRFIGTQVSATAAVKYAVDNGAAVLSNSWTQFNAYDQGLFDAIEYAKSKNVLFIAAAANENSNNDTVANYPSSYTNGNIIAVGAITQQEQRANFSNYGKTRVDLFAPGVGIWSTIPGNMLDSFQGTSMACPHVAGACTLVWAAKGGKAGANWSDIRTFILSNARKVPALQPLCVTGGTLDIGKLGDDVGGGNNNGGGLQNPAAGALLASDTFAATDNVVPDAGMLRSVKITLAKPMIVVVDAGFDFQSNVADSAFTVSIGTDAAGWTGATRNTGGAAGKFTTFAMNAPKKLEVGEYTIRVMTTANSNVKFGSGSITVVGYPLGANPSGVGAAAAATNVK